MFANPKSPDHTPEEKEISSTKKRESSILSKIQNWQQEPGVKFFFFFFFFFVNFNVAPRSNYLFTEHGCFTKAKNISV